MDQGELEIKLREIDEFGEALERRIVGLDRHFRGPDGFGWFSQDPNSIAPDDLQKCEFKINTVNDDLSGRKIHGVNGEYELPSTSFSIEGDLDETGASREFVFSHPKDIEEILQQAGVKQSNELIGRKIILYWIGDRGKPFPSDPTVGVALPKFSVPLSQLQERHQGK